MSWFDKAVQSAKNAKQTVLEKMGLAEKTIDKEFDAMEEKFKKLSSLVEKLVKDSKSWLDNTANLHKVATDIAADFDEYYQESADSVYAPASQIFKRLQDTQNTFTENAMNGKAMDIVEAIKQYSTTFTDLKAKIVKRNNILTDYDSLRYDIEKMQKKPPTDPTKLPRAQERFNTVSTEYETINRDLKRELLEFLLDRPHHFDNEFKTMMIIQNQLFLEGSRTFREYQQFLKPQSSFAPVEFNFTKIEPTAPAVDSAPPSITGSAANNVVPSAPPVVAKPPSYSKSTTTTTTTTSSVPRNSYVTAPPPPINPQYIDEQDSNTSYIPTAVQQQAGKAVANAAQNTRVQQQAGAAIANVAQSKSFQNQVGSAMRNSENPYVVAMGNNEKVTQGVGSAIAFAATNQVVQQQAGAAIANAAQNEQIQQKVANSIAPTTPQRPSRPQRPDVAS
jgi:hypothetical protein